MVLLISSQALETGGFPFCHSCLFGLDFDVAFINHLRSNQRQLPQGQLMDESAAWSSNPKYKHRFKQHKHNINRIHGIQIWAETGLIKSQ